MHSSATTYIGTHGNAECLARCSAPAAQESPAGGDQLVSDVQGQSELLFLSFSMQSV